ncbi:MAG: head-tail connector protein, partial [Holosporales bacterium]
MSLKLLEPSSTLLLPLRDVKNYLRIDHDIEDDLIKHLIL